jgi:RND family efflux transporter MFP subunit
MMIYKFVILPLLLVITAAITGCGEEEYEKTLTPVRVAMVSVQDENAPLRYTATVQPYSQVDLDFKVDGYVTEILQTEGADGRPRDVQEGDNVVKDLPLARIDQTEYLAKVAEARAQLHGARATHLNDTEDFNRAEILYSQKSMTAPEYDRAVKNFKVSASQVESAGAQLVEAEQNLSYCTLRAPSNGVLLKRYIEVGALVRPGSKGFTLADVTSVKVLFSVPDVVLDDVSLGEEMEVTTRSLQDMIFTGRITEIAPATNTRTRVFNVEITIQNPENLLKPGMIASLNVYEGDSSNALLLIPLGSVVRSVNSREGYAVFTIEDSDGKTLARRKDVQLGSVFGNRIAVTSGLEEGEQVITSGAQIIRNDQEVSIIR